MTTIGFSATETAAFTTDIATIAAGPCANFYVDLQVAGSVQIHDIGPPEAASRAKKLCTIFEAVGLHAIEWEFIAGRLQRTNRNLHLQVGQATEDIVLGLLSRWLADERIPHRVRSLMIELAEG